MKQLTTSLLAVFLTSATVASAQTTFRLGLRGGVHRALTTLAEINTAPQASYFSYAADKSPLYAWQAGAVGEANFGKFALQPALVFSQKGEVLHTAITLDGIARTVSERTNTTRYNWLELPVNLVYTLHGDHGLQVFAGPYVALAVGGHQSSTTAVNSQNFKSFDSQVAYGDATTNRRFDAGLNFGVGYRQGPVQVQVGYGLGLRNLHQPASSSAGTDPGFSPWYRDANADAAYNRVAQLTGTYFFAL